MASGKKQLTIRLDADLLDWLKGHDKGYRTGINRILRMMMERQPHSRLIGRTLRLYKIEAKSKSGSEGIYGSKPERFTIRKAALSRKDGPSARCSSMQEIREGKYCMFEILTQDGPLCKKVCQVTSDLIRLADRCFDEKSMKGLRRNLPSDMKTGSRLGAVVGGQLHEVLYKLAVRARQAGTLEPRLKITRPTNMQINLRYTLRGERSTAGPDFKLDGRFDGEDVHAAWDFTTSGALARHYDRDVLGIRRGLKSGSEQHPIDPEIQEAPDTVNFWSSYIAIFY